MAKYIDIDRNDLPRLTEIFRKQPTYIPIQKRVELATTEFFKKYAWETDEAGNRITKTRKSALILDLASYRDRRLKGK